MFSYHPPNGVSVSQTCKAEQILLTRLTTARARGADVEQQARSLVAVEVLQRAEDEAKELKLQVEKAEEETSQMRQKLANSWVTDAAEGFGDMENLEEMEQALQWLVKTQQAADNERQLVQRLERKEGALQKRLREVSEEKATLAFARVDLGDAGKAMRETMASQSEGYIRQLTGLEEARRIAFSARMKLMQDPFLDRVDFESIVFGCHPTVMKRKWFGTKKSGELDETTRTVLTCKTRLTNAVSLKEGVL